MSLENDIDNFQQISRFILDIYLKNGPIRVDTGMIAHNYEAQNEHNLDEFEDILVIGEEGREIVKSDIEKFLNKLHKNIELLDNGCSYFFKGIQKLSDKEYNMLWSS